MAVTTQDSQIIRNLRFPLTFVVVMQHSMGKVWTDMDWQALSGLDLYCLFKYLCSGCLALIAVPTFFFISGYLFYANISRMDMQVYKQKMRTRFSSLFVPYICWNLLCIPMLLLVTYGEALNGTKTMSDFTNLVYCDRWWHVFWDFFSNDASYTNLWGWPLLKNNPVLTTFWYVRDLLIMLILSPAIYWFAKKTRWIGFWCLVAIFVLRIWPHITLGPQSLFFVFGAYASILRGQLTINSKPIRIILYIAAAALTLLMLRLFGNDTYWGFLIAPTFTLVGCYAILNIMGDLVKKGKWPTCSPLLTKSSFFVYALHIEFALPLAFFVMKLVFKHAEHPLLLSLQYLLTPCLIYAICIFVYVMLQKYSPKLLALLNGSR
jgi:fucose 4-O-acetylase-like acetyltransferase